MAWPDVPAANRSVLAHFHAVADGPFEPHGPWTDDASGRGERFVPLVKPYDASLHLGHMASYREALRYAHAGRVLDLGCGVGYGAFFLASHGARSVVAADLDPVALAYARRTYAHPRLHYLRVAAPHLPFANASFDFVFSSQVVEHVASPDAFLREIRRVLTPDGFCLITTPNQRLFSPHGVTDNVHHLSEMDLTTYGRVASATFPRVQLRGIRQDCLEFPPGGAPPRAKRNADLQPENYRVQSHDLDRCENMLCYAHSRADGLFAQTLPSHLTAVADELAPLFWDGAIGRWVAMDRYSGDEPAEIVPLRLGRPVECSFRSRLPSLYRVEIDLACPIEAPVHVTLRRASGARLIRVASGRTFALTDRLVALFPPQLDSQDAEYVLHLRLPLHPRSLRHLAAPILLEGRVPPAEPRLSIRTFHAHLPPPVGTPSCTS